MFIVDRRVKSSRREIEIDLFFNFNVSRFVGLVGPTQTYRSKYTCHSLYFVEAITRAFSIHGDCAVGTVWIDTYIVRTGTRHRERLSIEACL